MELSCLTLLVIDTSRPPYTPLKTHTVTVTVTVTMEMFPRLPSVPLTSPPIGSCFIFLNVVTVTRLNRLRFDLLASFSAVAPVAVSTMPCTFSYKVSCCPGDPTRHATCEPLLTYRTRCR